jgi:hypothetical protein
VVGAAITLISFVIPVIAAAQAAPAPPTAGGTLQQRIDQRKKERNITLSKLDQDRLTARCVNVQGSVRQLQRNMTPIVAKRISTYQLIDGYLWVAVGKLKIGGNDTLELEKEHATYAQKVDALQKDFSYFQQSLDDIAVMNCQADLVGFKAMLETARLYLTQIKTEADDLQSYVVNTIKDTLTKQVTALQPQTTGGQ